MYSFDDTLRKIETGITKFRFSEHPRSLYDPIEYILGLGGKRIRPALTLLACNLFSDNVDQAVKPALGLEVFHNFTLLHDDLMDQADKRRNKPTVHKVWDANTAILSGDAMMIYAYQLVGETPEKCLKQVMVLFSKTALEICEGQQFDMEFESRINVSEEEYIEMIRLKTAVLLACCLKTGAIIGGASDKDADSLYEFGIHIGLAFQLQDDMLDVYGNPETFGKNIGGDILSNKKTFLLANALKMANKDQLAELTNWMEKPEFIASKKISAVTAIFNELEIKQLTEKRIQSYYSTSMQALNSLSIDINKASILKEVTDKLMFRQV